MALKSNRVGIYSAAYPTGSEMYSLPFIGNVGDVLNPVPWFADFGTSTTEYNYQFPAEGIQLGIGVDWSEYWEPEIINIFFPAIHGSSWVSGYREIWRMRELDRLQVSDISEAWANVTLSNPTKTVNHVEYYWSDTQPTNGDAWFYVNGNAKFYCTHTDPPIITHNIEISMGMKRIIPKANGTELEAQIISGNENVSSVASHNVPVKFDLTNCMKAYIGNCNQAYGFAFYCNADTGFTFPQGSANWNAILKAIYAKYCQTELSTQEWFYSFANGTQYMQCWSTGTITNTTITYSAMSIGSIYVRLGDGKILNVNDRVFYGRPPQFK